MAWHPVWPTAGFAEEPPGLDAGDALALGDARSIEADAERLQQLFRREAPHQVPLVEKAIGKQTAALLLQLDASCEAVDDLGQATEEAFRPIPTPRSC